MSLKSAAVNCFSRQAPRLFSTRPWQLGDKVCDVFCAFARSFNAIDNAAHIDRAAVTIIIIITTTTDGHLRFILHFQPLRSNNSTRKQQTIAKCKRSTLSFPSSPPNARRH
jgi:hypothetical protein